MSASKYRIGILISGRGSNMQALVEACMSPHYPVSVALVLSDKSDALGLEFARKAGIATMAISPRLYGRDRSAHEAALTKALISHNVEIVCLAGYMRILGPTFIKAWTNRLLNIHPSLLPKFKGLHTHERALAEGETHHGCTVHLVNEEVDGGPILAQASVPVLLGDTPEILAERVLQEEHKLYPKTLKAWLEKTRGQDIIRR